MHKRPYRPEIDGLRAIAVVAVIGYHYGLVDSLFKNGFIGVDVFFVISGFLITQILVSSFGQQNWLVDFYLRRIRRIFPALLFVLISTLIAGFFVLLPFELRELGKQVFFGGLFSSNLYFWSETGYFDVDAIRKPLLHLWSLGVEEQFYIIYPCVVLLAMKFGFRIRNCLVVILALSGLFLIFAENDPAMTYYSPFTRAWELILGGIAATLNVRFHAVVQMFLRSAGIVLLASGFAFASIGNSYPNTTTVFPVIGTAIILIFVQDKGFISKLLSNQLIVFIGKLSYSLYLWHWPLLSFFVISMGYPPGRYGKYLMLLLAFMLSYLTFRIVETPFARLRLRKSNVIPVFLLMISLSVLGLGISMGNGFPSRIETRANSSVSQVDVSKQFNTVEFSNPECLRDHPNPKASSYQWWFCRTNDSNDPQMHLWGNSYANQYFNGFSNNQYIRNLSILSIGDCPIQREKELVPPNPCAGTLFDEQRKFIENLIVSRGSIKTVILAGLKPISEKTSMKELSDALKFLQKEGRETIVFYPHITPIEPIFGCVSRPLRQATWDCDLSSTQYSKFLEDFKPTVEMIQRNYPSVNIYNPNSAFCKPKGCSFLISGLPIIRDGSGHISDWGSDLVAANFSSWLKNKRLLIN